MSIGRVALVPLFLTLPSVACAPFSVNVRSDLTAPSAGSAHEIFLEPFTEAADLELRRQAAGNATVYYQDKPFLAQQETLRRLYKGALKELGEQGPVRPLAAALNRPGAGPVLIARTTITRHVVESSDVNLQLLVTAIGVGMFCYPVCLYPTLVPTTVKEQARGVIQVFAIPPDELSRRLVTPIGSAQPYLDSTGLRPVLQREFELEIESQAGLLVRNWLWRDNQKEYVSAVTKALTDVARATSAIVDKAAPAEPERPEEGGSQLSL